MTKQKWITSITSIWLTILTGSFLHNALFANTSTIDWNIFDEFIVIATPLLIVLMRSKLLTLHRRAKTFTVYRWIFLRTGMLVIGLVTLLAGLFGLIFSARAIQVTSNPTYHSQDQKDPLGNDSQNPNFW
ncbi:hypothetical protein XMD579_002196 [Marinobacterium sp. xm-d-579]|uniref:hypothetical protein n=1 Tax=unclassified Marinobacterium TaxID=2644139 RepID=UPI001568914E|nr:MULTISPECIES: hypothetical protein [unclassified Marinobacterium]NRP10931.1 hypothetical protein [Marinobacterium sp. xm-g-48]NRP37354.1 hypothetical protein [Marinobacterium sp. xm-d-579]NRP83144.1 hypothetical protein [Marinobacterium sp. xm-d-509]NRP95626.1 hypothetical protein [Marinobacterium sp. xm-g-59]